MVKCTSKCQLMIRPSTSTWAKARGAWLAPVMLGGILALPDRGRYDLESLRWVVGGGERTPEARIRGFRDLFTKARYIDAYGLTESCSGDTMMEPGRELEKIGSVGRALAHVEVEIRAPTASGWRPARPANSACVVRRSRKAIGKMRRKRKRRSSAIGFARAMSAISMSRAFCI
jgi:fatty-acyl-CoA synthase